MPSIRRRAAFARARVAVTTTFVLLLPAVSHASAANHDMQKMDVHASTAIKHDRALGPATGAEQPSDGGVN